MKRILLSLAFLSLAYLSFTQEKGINFEQGQSWRQIKARAKAENKFIFIDIYATWCVPCKEMDQSVYASEEAGTYINDKFISVKVQFDKTNNDNDAIKSWYADAQQLMSDYTVDVLPGLLFFSPGGVLVNKGTGALSIEKFIKLADESMNLSKEYDAKLKKLNKGQLSASELKELAVLAREMRDIGTAETAASSYINNYLFSLPERELLGKENLLFMHRFLDGPGSKSYQFFKKQSEEINLVLGEYQAQYAIMNYINRKYLPKSSSWSKVAPNWDVIEKNIEKNFGSLGTEVVHSQRMFYYSETKNWNEYATWYRKYLVKNLNHPRYDINYLSWTLFENSNDSAVLKFACDTVMKYAIEKWYQNDPQCFDTYANLLYKTGRKELAIEWEERAVKLSNNDKVLVEYLDKMKKGIKTWEK